MCACVGAACFFCKRGGSCKNLIIERAGAELVFERLFSYGDDKKMGLAVFGRGFYEMCGISSL